MLRNPISSLVIVVIGICSFIACDVSDSSEPDGRQYSYEFEENLSGWNTEATDVMVGDEEVQWSVEHTTEASHENPGAIRFYLENNSDAGKLWMERAFTLGENQNYLVNVNFDFGTTDYGTVNLWTIIAGTHQENPDSRDDLTFQGDTGHNQNQDAGLIWLEKNYSFEAQTDEDGELYIALGVWGTYEVPRTYFIDDVHITFTEQ